MYIHIDRELKGKLGCRLDVLAVVISLAVGILCCMKCTVFTQELPSWRPHRDLIRHVSGVVYQPDRAEERILVHLSEQIPCALHAMISSKAADEPTLRHLEWAHVGIRNRNGRLLGVFGTLVALHADFQLESLQKLYEKAI